MGNVFSRLAGLILLGLIGWAVGNALNPENVRWLLVWGLGGGVLGGVTAPYMARAFQRWLRRKMARIPASVFISAIVGLVVALVLSALLSVPLSLLPGVYGIAAPIAAAVVLVYLGISLLTARSGTMAGLLDSRTSPQNRTASGWHSADSRHAIIDTSAIIDGRIADISRAGFGPGILVIPKFVLEELQYIADSSDALRRQRGRRGLEMLNKLQKEAAVPVEISETDYKDAQGVDAKLVRMAKATGYPVITNDFGLNRVAELQGARALNINQLATAVKPLILPGEDMEIRIVQEGKEFGQGVGFLDDGTMVVVEEGRHHLNNSVGVVVTRVLQTAVGRMIFAHLKDGAGRDRGPRG